MRAPKRSSSKDGGNARRGARIFALSGDLGAGKTTFAQGFLKGLGASGRATSPTFVIMRRHPIKHSRTDVYHIDAYRLKKPEDLAALGFSEIAANDKNIILIEWAEKIKKLLPKRTVWLRFRYGRSEGHRTIRMDVL